MNDGNKVFRDDKYFVYFYFCDNKMKVKVNIWDFVISFISFVIK